MSFFQKKQSGLKGAYSELQVELKCLSFGWQVFRPTRPDGEIDLLVITPDGIIHALQIRAANFVNRGPHGGKRRLGFSLTKWNGEKYSSAVTEFVAVYEGRMWVFPASECKGIKKVFRPLGSDREEAWHLVFCERTSGTTNGVGMATGI